jgi:hypothetical protein
VGTVRIYQKRKQIETIKLYWTQNFSEPELSHSKRGREDGKGKMLYALLPGDLPHLLHTLAGWPPIYIPTNFQK